MQHQQWTQGPPLSPIMGQMTRCFTTILSMRTSSWTLSLLQVKAGSLLGAMVPVVCDE